MWLQPEATLEGREEMLINLSSVNSAMSMEFTTPDQEEITMDLNQIALNNRRPSNLKR